MYHSFDTYYCAIFAFDVLIILLIQHNLTRKQYYNAVSNKTQIIRQHCGFESQTKLNACCSANAVPMPHNRLRAGITEYCTEDDTLSPAKR